MPQQKKKGGEHFTRHPGPPLGDVGPYYLGRDLGVLASRVHGSP